MTTPTVLERKTLTTAALVVRAVVASAVVVVLIGAIPQAYATTGVKQFPLLFLLVGAVIVLLSVGYTAMARQVRHPAVYYAAIAAGLGRAAGVGGGFVAILGYNAILIAQYGLFGFFANDLFGHGPWWVWALIAAGIVALFGTRGAAGTTALMVIVLAASLLVVVCFDGSALHSPATGHLSSAGFNAAGITAGIGGGTAYVIASLMGFELPGAFAEERRSGASPARAVFVALISLVVIYTVTAYAVSASTGAQNVAAANPLGFLGDRFGGAFPPIAQFVLLAAILTSMLAFHTTVGRYVLAIAREGVLPAGLAHTGSGERAVAPVAASWLQTALSVITIAGFALAGADPLATLFAWFSALGALSLLGPLLLTSLSSLRALPRTVGAGVRLVAPLLGVVSGAVIFVVMLVNLGALMGTHGPAEWVIPLVVIAVAVAGMLWAGHLRRVRPDVYDNIGGLVPDVNATVDARLADLEF